MIAKGVSGGKSFGLDLSLGMAKIAQKRLSRGGLLDISELMLSDTLPIPLLSGSIDGIFSSFTLELFDSPLIPKVLAECRRVLKPTGRLVIVSLSKDQPLGWMGRTYEALHNRFPILADCRPIPVLPLLKNAGFTIIDSHLMNMWGLPVMSVKTIKQ
jgi:demethylmenaquinone methyltransferase/2-methoxy-6-polyprenyl-1,4-benzoquinol methylase